MREEPARETEREPAREQAEREPERADFRQLSSRDVELFKAGMEYGRQIGGGIRQPE